MTERKMNVVVTLMLTADAVTNEETGKTEVVLRNVGNTVMASLFSPEGQAEVTQEFKNGVATVITKAGLAYMLNDIEGKHAEPPPAVNQPSASA